MGFNNSVAALLLCLCYYMGFDRNLTVVKEFAKLLKIWQISTVSGGLYWT